MAATIWGTNATADFQINSDGADAFNLTVADAGGGGFGVAWTSAAGVTVRFFDMAGNVDPALSSLVISDGFYGATGQASAVRNAVMSAGGSTIGYGVVWEETSVTDPAAPSILRGRYIGLSTPVGGEFAIAAEAGVEQHDAAMSGYGVDDANGKPIVDGLNVVWVSTSAADGLTAQQIADGYGRIMLQRFEVALDAKKDPLGPPQAAGLDGRSGAGSNAPVNVGAENGLGAAVIGRDPSTIVTGDGETVIAWVDTASHVHTRVYDLAGAVIDAGIAGANLANLGTVSAGGEAKAVDLAGAGFVIAWVDSAGSSIVGQVFAGGPGVFAAGPVIQLATGLPASFNGEFSLATLPDGGGFALSWTQAGPSGLDVMVKHFNSAGGGDGVVTVANTTTAGDQSAPALAGLTGDRIVAVYADNPTAATGDQTIRASILDTRTDGVINSLLGLVLLGTDTATKVIDDDLVGGVGQDVINGLGGDDTLHGALGDDRITGGAGDDVIFGDGGADVAIFSGQQSDYLITHLGADIFTVQDLRPGVPDGVDTVRGAEFFEFSDGAGGTAQVATAAFVPLTGVTPTAWGHTDADADTAPDAAGTPDVDGFIVNHAPASKTGLQSNPVIADSIGEFFGVLWETPGADGFTHIRGQFYDVIGNFDEFIPNAIDISDGVGIEFNAAIVSGGANSGWGVAWEQLDTPTDVSATLRTNFVGPGQLTGPERSVFDEGELVNQHDADLAGLFLDRTVDIRVPPSPLGVDPKTVSDGYTVAWVSTDLDAAGAPTNVPGDASYGRIMMQNFEVPLDALGNPGAPVAAGQNKLRDAGVNNDGEPNPDNDEAFWVGAEDTGAGGAVGRDPSAVGMHGFETAVIWIEQDGHGGERVAGRAYDDLGQVIQVAGMDDISGVYSVAPHTKAHAVQAGAVNFAVVWVTADATSPSGYTVMGTMFSPTGAGVNGEGFGFAAPEPFVLTQLPAGVDIEHLDFEATGIDGEDSEDIIISWTTTTSNGDEDMMAQHIKVALDPETGFAISMAAEGAIITVNAETSGNQGHGGLAGLLGERFVAVYQDDNATYTDGGDIVARVVDTRDPANPDPITGDLIRNGDPQARRDVLVGTNGNDVIRGDISDADGLVDFIYAGMGDDVIMGGPGLRGAAGIPEIIDGGEGFDIAVLTGRPQDYSITVNGDGGYEVIDLRPTSDAAGNPLQNDGIDNLISVERIRFLNLTQDDPNPVNPPAPTEITFGFPGQPPASPADYDGTPVAWSLTDTSQYKEIQVSASPALETSAAVAGLQTEAALAWISGGSEVWAVRYDVTGAADPLFSTAPVQLTDGSAGGAAVSDIDIGMTGGLGFTAVWEASQGGDTAIHLRTGSTNTHVVLDPNAGVPGSGLAGGEISVVGSDGAGVAVDPVVKGYEIVNSANDTLEFGFHVGYVMKATAADGYGTLQLARYEIPVYDVLVDAAGDPVLDGAGQGQLATDAFGNLAPSTDLNTGSETAPVSIGMDGLRGTADDGAALTLTDANGAPIMGRDLSLASLHDGQLVITYIGEDEHVHLKIFVPTVDQTADRETGGVGADVVATGVTTYSELEFPFSADLGLVAQGQTQYAVAQQNGAFGVFWAAPGGSGDVAIQAIIYPGAGTNWSPTDVITLALGLPAGVEFQVSPTGVTPGGLEDGFLLTWDAGAGVVGQRFDMTGALVGAQIAVGDPTTGTPTSHFTAGLEDGRILVGYEDGSGDIAAQYLDTREPGVPIIGPRTGAPRDVAVGTVGDDAMDGRALEDELFGGLGNDLITLGSGADIGHGGEGNDTIIGGTGQDQLLGGAGDDLLWGGLSGPIDPQVDRDLQTGLVAAGVSTALIASDPGADIISGGLGVDTISFQGELGSFDISLNTGIVQSDRNGGGMILEDVIGQIVDDGAGGLIFNFINDVENATGGLGDDVITGDVGDNVLNGGGGSDAIDGLGGVDTVVIDGNLADYLVSYDPAAQTFTIVESAAGGDPAQTLTVSNVEFFQFADGTRTAAQLVPGPVAANDIVAAVEDTSVTFDARANDSDGQTLSISSINGTQIAVDSPVAVDNGMVALGADGRLTFTPAANFFGSTQFAYQAVDGQGRFTGATVSVTVANTNDTPTDLIFNNDASVTALSLAENSAANATVATLSALDPDNAFGVVNDAFTFTLADSIGGRFKIVDNQIQVQNGALLDFENAVHDYVLAVTANDGRGGVITENVAVHLTNANEAPASISSTGTAITEAAANGAIIGTLSAVDPEGAAVKFALADDAGGRFKIVNDGTSFKLAVADNLLIDHRPDGDGAHVYSVQVTAIDASGASSAQTFNITAAGVAENRITGNANQNTLNGTAGNDYINGGANKDTMAGGAGADVYIVDNGGDKVTENANQGVDTIYTTLNSFDLSKSANVENLVYTGTAAFTGKASNSGSTIIGGVGGDRLQGGNGADVLSGLGGADVLQGGGGGDMLIGGAGNDTLTGGAGADTFIFHPGFGADVITDFAVTGANHDVIEIDQGLFANLDALLAASVQAGANVVVTVDASTTITLNNVTTASLTANPADFHFV